MRFSFAFSGVNERNGDVTPTILVQWLERDLIEQHVGLGRVVSVTDYCTTSVSFVEFVSVVEPEVKVPITVRL
jgi:hypothetical protein